MNPSRNALTHRCSGRMADANSLDRHHPAAILMDKNQQPIRSREAWEERRKNLISEWESVLGPAPTCPENLAIEVLDQEVLEEHAVVRERITYRVEPGFRTEAYRLFPKDRQASSRPACLVCHSTVDHTIRQPAGLEGPSELHLGLQLARLGFVTLCPMNFLWRFGDGPEKFQHAVTWLHEHHPASTTGMAVMLHEARMALKALRQDPRVDSSRIGAIGHSLGAKEVLYLAAFEPGLRATVFSEGGLALADSNWEAPWYLGPQVRRPEFPLDHARLLSLIAPRSFLVIGGDSADGERTEPTIQACRPVWNLYSGDDPVAAPGCVDRRLGFINHHGGHQLPPQAHDQALDWLERHLEGSPALP